MKWSRRPAWPGRRRKSGKSSARCAAGSRSLGIDELVLEPPLTRTPEEFEESMRGIISVLADSAR